MKKIKTDIYLESTYAGVTVGAVLLERGTVLIDAPLKPEDGRAWLAALEKQGALPLRLLVNLDAHPDRTLGAQILEAEVVAQREAARQFQHRSAVFKALKQETGAEWEQLSGLSGLRWVTPRAIYSEQASLRLGESEVRLEHHPGPSAGASWAILPKSKVVFIGDAVVAKQPPFLALAHIPSWVEALDVLLSKDFKDYRVISGRGAVIGPTVIRNQRRFLKDVESRLGRLAKRKAAAKEAEKLAPKLLEKYKYPKKYEGIYGQRLRHGLRQYYERHH